MMGHMSEPITVLNVLPVKDENVCSKNQMVICIKYVNHKLLGNFMFRFLF